MLSIFIISAFFYPCRCIQVFYLKIFLCYNFPWRKKHFSKRFHFLKITKLGSKGAEYSFAIKNLNLLLDCIQVCVIGISYNKDFTAILENKYLTIYLKLLLKYKFFVQVHNSRKYFVLSLASVYNQDSYGCEFLNGTNAFVKRCVIFQLHVAHISYVGNFCEICVQLFFNMALNFLQKFLFVRFGIYVYDDFILLCVCVDFVFMKNLYYCMFLCGLMQLLKYYQIMLDTDVEKQS
eukprot:TRINITY_DN24140_c0_g2_i3.p2 TRINITY_DN24140_c0_g2~~TRINITY_DN24140_c0_g2_i3.p2  ORF type:complete len:235 (+),score=-11.85 TRINITY_DN24140_c0_g2_i3:914-1618(+)